MLRAWYRGDREHGPAVWPLLLMPHYRAAQLLFLSRVDIRDLCEATALSRTTMYRIIELAHVEQEEKS